MSIEDEKYIRRCIQLAKNGIYQASPNPLVGAVIVHKGKIIGEGYHIRYGGAHAEVNAIQSVVDKKLLKESTIYVSLEPCAHHGKTPPCADLIIDKQIPKVVIGCIDPFAKVAGKGIQKLQQAGVEVITGILEKECKELIKRFITFHSFKRPYIILKWAESKDGYMDVNRRDGSPYIFSTPLTSLLVHKRRAEANGIIVGTNTAILDNPSLTVRNWYGNNPTRIVIDRHQKLPRELNLFSEEALTFVCTDSSLKKNLTTNNIYLDFNKKIIPQLMTQLYSLGIQTLLVEGGSKLLKSFIESSYWDEAYVEKANIFLKEGITSPTITNAENIEEENFFNVPIIHYSKQSSF